MRHYLLALAIAAASFCFTGNGNAETRHSVQYYGDYQQKCFTKRIKVQDQRGDWITKRVRICQ